MRLCAAITILVLLIGVPAEAQETVYMPSDVPIFEPFAQQPPLPYDPGYEPGQVFNAPLNPFYSGEVDPLQPQIRDSYDRYYVESGWYVSGTVGAQGIEQQDNVGPNRSTKIDFDPDFGTAFGLGYRIGRHRYELAFEYRTNSVKELTFNTVPQPTARGSSRTYAGMINYYIDFLPNRRNFRPYIGAGLGFAEVDHNVRYGMARFIDSDTVLAYQAIGGVSGDIPKRSRMSPEGMEWFAEFRYFGTTHPTLNRFGGPPPPINTLMKSEYNTYGMMIGLRLNLN